MTDEASTSKLLDDLQAVVRDAEALLKATAAETGEKIQEARERAADSLRQAKARLHQTDEGLMASARDAVDKATSRVKENPWQSLGIAAAIGLVVGLLLRRRD